MRIAPASCSPSVCSCLYIIWSMQVCDCGVCCPWVRPFCLRQWCDAVACWLLCIACRGLADSSANNCHTTRLSNPQSTSAHVLLPSLQLRSHLPPAASLRLLPAHIRKAPERRTDRHRCQRSQALRSASADAGSIQAGSTGLSKRTAPVNDNQTVSAIPYPGTTSAPAALASQMATNLAAQTRDHAAVTPAPAWPATWQGRRGTPHRLLTALHYNAFSCGQAKARVPHRAAGMPSLIARDW
jgi:hypothetical protein